MLMDRKTAKLNGSLYDRWEADIASTSDAYPYGMPMNGRTTEHIWSRQSFNGQQKDDEVYGKGNMTTALHWQYDTRLGPNGRWNLDPKPNPTMSPYATFSGNPILYRDVLGDTTFFFMPHSSKPFLTLNDGHTNLVSIVNEGNESIVRYIVNFIVVGNLDRSSAVAKVSKDLRRFGTTYDLQSLSNWKEKYKNAGAVATHIRERSLENAVTTLDGKPITPRGEVIGNLERKGNVIRPGEKVDLTSKNMTISNSTNVIGKDDEVKATIHLHPEPGKFEWARSVLDGGITIFTEDGPTFRTDYNGHTMEETKVRSIVIEGQYIYLHNRNKQEDIKVNLPAPSKK